jgi:hypothetical protein
VFFPVTLLIETRAESIAPCEARVKVMLLIPFTCFLQDKSKALLYRRKISCSTELFQHYNNVDTAQLLGQSRIISGRFPCSKLPRGNNDPFAN